MRTWFLVSRVSDWRNVRGAQSPFSRRFRASVAQAFCSVLINKTSAWMKLSLTLLLYWIHFLHLFEGNERSLITYSLKQSALVRYSVSVEATWWTPVSGRIGYVRTFEMFAHLTGRQESTVIGAEGRVRPELEISDDWRFLSFLQQRLRLVRYLQNVNKSVTWFI